MNFLTLPEISLITIISFVVEDDHDALTLRRVSKQIMDIVDKILNEKPTLLSERVQLAKSKTIKKVERERGLNESAVGIILIRVVIQATLITDFALGKIKESKEKLDYRDILLNERNPKIKK